MSSLLLHVTALIATATKASHQTICHVLGTRKPAVIYRSLNKPKIKYSVFSKKGTIEETFVAMVEEFKDCTGEDNYFFAIHIMIARAVFVSSRTGWAQKTPNLLVHLT